MKGKSKNKDNSKRRFPAGMTNQKTGNSNGKNRQQQRLMGMGGGMTREADFCASQRDEAALLRSK